MKKLLKSLGIQAVTLLLPTLLQTLVKKLDEDPEIPLSMNVAPSTPRSFASIDKSQWSAEDHRQDREVRDAFRHSARESSITTSEVIANSNRWISFVQLVTDEIAGGHEQVSHLYEILGQCAVQATQTHDIAYELRLRADQEDALAHPVGEESSTSFSGDGTNLPVTGEDNGGESISPGLGFRRDPETGLWEHREEWEAEDRASTSVAG